MLMFCGSTYYFSGATRSSLLRNLQAAAICSQIFFLASIAHLGYICCSDLQYRFRCINKEIYKLQEVCHEHLYIGKVHCSYIYSTMQRSEMHQKIMFKKAWMTKESEVSVRVLRHCFEKLANAISYVNTTFDKFWFMDTLQLTVTTVSTLGRIAISSEMFSKSNIPTALIAAATIVRLLLLSIFCGDVTDEVNFHI